MGRSYYLHTAAQKLIFILHWSRHPLNNLPESPRQLREIAFFLWELTCSSLIYSKSKQIVSHWAANPFECSKRAIRKMTAGVKRRKAIPLQELQFQRYFFTKSGCSLIASEIEQKIIPFSANVSLKDVLQQIQNP